MNRFWASWVVIGCAQVASVFAQTPDDRVERLEREARTAAATGLCETCVFTADQLRDVDRARWAALLAEPPIAACARRVNEARAASIAQPAPSGVPNDAESESTPYAPWHHGAYLGPSLLLGGARAERPFTSPGFGMLRVSLGYRGWTQGGLRAHIGGVFEASPSGGFHLPYAAGGLELRLAWPITRGPNEIYVGPRASVVVLENDFVGLWAGARLEYRDVSIGFDLLRVLPGDPKHTSREAIGAYGVIGLHNRAGAGTSLAMGLLVGVLFVGAIAATLPY